MYRLFDLPVLLFLLWTRKKIFHDQRGYILDKHTACQGMRQMMVVRPVSALPLVLARHEGCIYLQS